MRRRALTITAIVLVAGLAVTATVVVAGQRSDLARAASARIPAFPGQADCRAYDGAGEVRLDQVAVTVQSMLRLKFHNPARLWFGRVPLSTSHRDVGDHYEPAMPSALRRDDDFPNIGVDYYLWVWSYQGRFGSRAVAVAFVQYPYSPVAAGRPPVADFKWLVVVDSMPRDKLDAEPDPPCAR